jgi:hypothetical protein
MFSGFQGFDGPLPVLAAGSDCLPVQKLMMTGLAMANRKVVHSIQNPLGSAVRKHGKHEHQVPLDDGAQFFVYYYFGWIMTASRQIAEKLFAERQIAECQFVQKI